MDTKEDAERKSKEREELEKRCPVLKEGLGNLIMEMQKCLLNQGMYPGTVYQDMLVDEINRRERYFKKHEINHDSIGSSLRAEGYRHQK